MSTADQIIAQISSSTGLCVSPTWLSTFLASSTAQRNIPASALTKTALFRVLGSDFRESLARNPSSLFPIDVSDPKIQERRLPGPIPVQVLDIEDIGTSLWSQVEAIERVERGEAIRGREIVRTVSVGEDAEAAANNGSGTNPAASGSSGSGPHRLILQDMAGTKVVAIEMQRIDAVSLEKLAIGAKFMLRGVTVARGMILLDSECATLLGGKIELLDRPWKEGRKSRLLERIASMEGSDT
ncbi:uncharacterized protein N7484_007238 [Penicillium longicatenatum]|uniref:uncharacterized protein n=1 Tax=Penicillium longicatenatum TaxID=1561947 RepID=UPI00254944D5|nr:uncharacterized protein N7484_007238 [Penicillium longicatenatum]KAJ5639376.1 hypothetical protein N7484_007238 [Penicillium longicatenatum]